MYIVCHILQILHMSSARKVMAHVKWHILGQVSFSYFTTTKLKDHNHKFEQQNNDFFCVENLFPLLSLFTYRINIFRNAMKSLCSKFSTEMKIYMHFSKEMLNEAYTMQVT